MFHDFPAAFFRHVAWQNENKKYQIEKSIKLVYDHTHTLQASNILDTKKIRKHAQVIILLLLNLIMCGLQAAHDDQQGDHQEPSLQPGQLQRHLSTFSKSWISRCIT